ncbi:hypothetical protein EVAR_85530_1 [Eumeta japonica]|uniref:Uncharacterized protein n=1 Tax=Eumeta variegata TaxID=151549 RepID=A0A4C1VBP8_EUMVA|nr:hypothetical protein EVAR_85530_1 [Eumeta japonica]
MPTSIHIGQTHKPLLGVAATGNRSESGMSWVSCPRGLGLCFTIVIAFKGTNELASHQRVDSHRRPWTFTTPEEPIVQAVAFQTVHCRALHVSALAPDTGSSCRYRRKTRGSGRASARRPSARRTCALGFCSRAVFCNSFNDPTEPQSELPDRSRTGKGSTASGEERRPPPHGVRRAPAPAPETHTLETFLSSASEPTTRNTN